MKCGLLGRSLGHSYSPQIHADLGDYSYDLFEKEPKDIENFLRNGDFTGINVTIPYKKTVIPFLDELTPAANKMGAVNTIVRRKDGSLLGHNTDYFGFVSLLEHSGIPVEGRKVLVLGSGGASNTAVQALLDLGASPIVISRSGENNYENLHLHADASVIVNATPVGMYPQNGVSPVDPGLFPRLEGVLDVIYNPSKTQLILDAEARGIPAENGLWMLVAQAKEAAEYFTGSRISDAKIAVIHKKLSAQMKNIALIGMPGCGKSTVGAMLAKRLGRELVDLDTEIAKLAGKSIPAVFAEDGEAVFRMLETRVLKEFGKRSGLILATGGGCVTQPRNYPPSPSEQSNFLASAGLGAAPHRGAALSQINQLSDMYVARKPMYEAFADFAVDNNGSCDDTVTSILELLEG